MPTPEQKMTQILAGIRDVFGIESDEDELQCIKDLSECIDHHDAETLEPLLNRLYALMDLVPDSANKKLAKKWCNVLALGDDE